MKCTNEELYIINKTDRIAIKYKVYLFNYSNPNNYISDMKIWFIFFNSYYDAFKLRNSVELYSICLDRYKKYIFAFHLQDHACANDWLNTVTICIILHLACVHVNGYGVNTGPST